jgi:serine/threonine-protein kinase
VTVPSVVSLTQNQAVADLKSAGFVPQVSTAASSTVPKGSVIIQSPQAGAQRPPKSTVNITISTGPGQVAVPDVTGFTVASAQATIQTAGLVVGQVVSVDDPSVNKGDVISTVPAANSTVAAGSTVMLKVASGKVKVPNVVGANRSDAQQTLTNARLTYTTQFADSSLPEGTVLSQTQAGEVVDTGTQIVLTVAQVPQPTPTPAPTPTTSTPTPSTPTSTGAATTSAPALFTGPLSGQ